jgi:hypothetical protein
MTRNRVRSLFIVGLASPLLLAAFAAQAARASLSVTSGGSTVAHTQSTPDAFVLDVGGTVATVQFARTPLCVGMACGIDGPAVSATLLAGNGSAMAETTARYSFSVVGGPGPVPILLSGLYSVFNPPELPDGSGGTIATGTLGIASSLGQTAFSFQSLCYNYTYFMHESAPPRNCGSGSFSGSFMASAGSTFSVVLGAFVGRVFPDAAPGPASAYIDPFFQIDPAWAAAHSGYSLLFEPGVGNGPPGGLTTAVPEPETVALMAAGLALLSRRIRRARR